MARTEISVQAISRDGLQPTYSALIADGHMFKNDGEHMFLHVKNDITPFTLTIQTPQTVDGLAVAEKTVSIGTSEEQFVGPFPVRTYNQASDLVYVDYSNVTDGTVAALRLPRS